MKEKYPLINNGLPSIKGEFIKREYFTPDITDILIFFNQMITMMVLNIVENVKI